MHYPPEGSNKARAAVEAELIKAVRLHDERKRQWESSWSFPESESLRKCILSVFLIYARKAIELRASGVWTVDQVRQEALEGVRVITVEVGYRRNYRSFLDTPSGYIRAEAQREFEATTEWRQFEDELLAHATDQASESGPSGTPANPNSTRTILALLYDHFRDGVDSSSGSYHHAADQIGHRKLRQCPRQNGS